MSVLQALLGSIKTANILSAGDSTTRGQGATDLETKSYPGQLATLLGQPVIREGYGGTNTQNWVDTYLHLFDDHYDATKEVNIACILLGTNDLLQGVSMSVTEANLVTIVHHATAIGWKVILGAPGRPLYVGGNPDSDVLRDYIRDHQSALGWTKYVSIRDDVRVGMANGSNDAYYTQANSTNDAVHYGDLGYGAIAQLFAAKIAELL